MNAFLKGLLSMAVALAVVGTAPAFANSLHPATYKSQKSPKQEQAESKAEQAAPKDEAKTEAKNEAQNGAQDAAKESADGQNGKEMVLSLPEDGAASSPSGAAALKLPEKDDGKLGFLEGGWSIDRDFVQQDGKKAHMEFSFDENGNGKSCIVAEDGTRYEADAKADYKDGKLKIQTGTYANKDRSETYSGEFIECQEIDGKTYCKGSNGWSSWSNARIVQDDKAMADAKSSFSRSSSSYERSSSSNASNGASGGSSESYSSSKSSSSSSSSRKSSGQVGPAEVAAHQFAELFAGGAELSPDVMEDAKKAKADKQGSVSSLAGDWRYSKDLARRDDGQSVALEFHFDKSGNGTSVIKDASGKEYLAQAEAATLPDSRIRVKTSAYTSADGEGGYFPTFMECKASKGKGSVSDLSCDVSNGWTRLEDGSLVATESLGEKAEASKMMLLVPGEAAYQSESSGSKSSKASSLSLPKAGSSLSFLKGVWRCNTGLVRTSDNQPVVMDFSFDGNGNGDSVIREQSGTNYRASAKASFDDGVLRINTSEFRSKGKRGGYPKHFIECTQQDGIAICSGRNGSIKWEQATFTRMK